MKTGEVPESYPFPAEQLRHYARCLVADGKGDAYQRFRNLCDTVILGVSPATPQVRFARVLGMSRTTLRTMIRRLGLRRADGRKAVAS